MQPIGFVPDGDPSHVTRAMTSLRRYAGGAILVFTVYLGVASGASADTNESVPSITGASNGGVASASTDGDIMIGEIITGENTGNSIMTGNIAGSAELNGGEIDYPTNVTITQNLAPPIATADGGDAGVASGSAMEPPVFNVDISNKDTNNNRSNATGIGEGGEGGAGGAGGDATINQGGAP